jgi:uncharacterized protein (TIGR01777 family)
MSLRVAITGSTGLIGTALVEYFIRCQYHITRIVRLESDFKSKDHLLYWDIKNRRIDKDALEGYDVIINLAGANISDKRWTLEYKTLIHSSRVEGTTFLAQTLADLKSPPKLFLSGSAVGFYGSFDNNKKIDETSSVGNDFLAQVCADWEKATEPAVKAGIRVVHMRMGMVLSSHGGALQKMMPIFQWGLGGKIGSGRQWMSWIAIDEIPLIIQFLIDHENIKGPVNFVSPTGTSNEDFTKCLGEILQRPTFFKVPSFGVNLMFGEMGSTLLLNGLLVQPKKLLDSGYQFSYPKLNDILQKYTHSVHD